MYCVYILDCSFDSICQEEEKFERKNPCWKPNKNQAYTRITRNWRSRVFARLSLYLDPFHSIKLSRNCWRAFLNEWPEYSLESPVVISTKFTLTYAKTHCGPISFIRCLLQTVCSPLHKTRDEQFSSIAFAKKTFIFHNTNAICIWKHLSA